VFLLAMCWVEVLRDSRFLFEHSNPAFIRKESFRKAILSCLVLYRQGILKVKIAVSNFGVWPKHNYLNSFYEEDYYV